MTFVWGGQAAVLGLRGAQQGVGASRSVYSPSLFVRLWGRGSAPQNFIFRSDLWQCGPTGPNPCYFLCFKAGDTAQRVPKSPLLPYSLA